jgi:hypothetical protein
MQNLEIQFPVFQLVVPVWTAWSVISMVYKRLHAHALHGVTASACISPLLSTCTGPGLSIHSPSLAIDTFQLSSSCNDRIDQHEVVHSLRGPSHPDLRIGSAHQSHKLRLCRGGHVCLSCRHRVPIRHGPCHHRCECQGLPAADSGLYVITPLGETCIVRLPRALADITLHRFKH